jgi:K+-transporting ATPase ATPase B chain
MTWRPAGARGFAIQINLWLWFTLLFANFAEAVAEGRGKAQADSLRRTAPRRWASGCCPTCGARTGLYQPIPAPELAVGDVVLVEAGDIFPRRRGDRRHRVGR